MRAVVPFLASIFCTTSIQVSSHRISKPLSSAKRVCDCPKLSIRFIASHRPTVSWLHSLSLFIAISTTRVFVSLCTLPLTTLLTIIFRAMVVKTFLYLL